jgi:hypothetical protein
MLWQAGLTATAQGRPTWFEMTALFFFVVIAGVIAPKKPSCHFERGTSEKSPQKEFSTSTYIVILNDVRRPCGKQVKNLDRGYVLTRDPSFAPAHYPRCIQDDNFS